MKYSWADNHVQLFKLTVTCVFQLFTPCHY
jgi:hypothetical protein